MNKIILFSLLILSVAISCSKDDQDARDKFIGTYSVNEACPSGNSNYEITITTSAQDGNAVLINNFLGLNQPISAKANISGNNINIPNQVLNVQGISVTINSGSGSINGSILTITYGYSVGTDTESCTMTCTKK